MLNEIEKNVVNLFTRVVFGTDKMDNIDDVKILGFGSKIFDLIINNIFIRSIDIRIRKGTTRDGDFDFIGTEEHIGMEVTKIDELVCGHMINILFNDGQIIFFHIITLSSNKFQFNK